MKGGYLFCIDAAFTIKMSYYEGIPTKGVYHFDICFPLQQPPSAWHLDSVYEKPADLSMDKNTEVSQMVTVIRIVGISGKASAVTRRRFLNFYWLLDTRRLLSNDFSDLWKYNYVYIEQLEVAKELRDMVATRFSKQNSISRSSIR